MLRDAHSLYKVRIKEFYTFTIYGIGDLGSEGFTYTFRNLMSLNVLVLFQAIRK